MKLSTLLVAASLACAVLAVAGTASAEIAPGCAAGAVCQNVEGCLDSGAPVASVPGSPVRVACPA